MIIEVKSLPLRDVIHDIAEGLGHTYYEECDEYIVKVPLHLGRGVIRGINFSCGLGVVLYDCLFTEDMEFRFTVSEVHPLKFIYCTKGTLNHRFDGSNNRHHTIDRFQNAIVASSGKKGHIIDFQKNIHTSISSLEIIRSEFISKIECDLSKMESELQSLFQDVDARESFYYGGYYSLNQSDIFRSIHEFEPEGVIRKLFLEGKAYEMLTEQILNYGKDVRQFPVQRILSEKEIEGIEAAVEYIKDNLSGGDISVSRITEIAGIPIPKLQEGFKLMYNNTVNSYLQELRLQTARALLEDTNLNVSEIVYKVGLSNKSYFTRMFYARFNINPSEYRRLNKK